MTATINFAITRGDDYAASVTFDQLVASFSEMRFTVREQPATSEADNTDAVLTVTLAATGSYTAQLELTAAQTVALLNDRYYYDIQVTTTSGSKKYTTQRGQLRVEFDVTR